MWTAIKWYLFVYLFKKSFNQPINGEYLKAPHPFTPLLAASVRGLAIIITNYIYSVEGDWRALSFVTQISCVEYLSEWL